MKKLPIKGFQGTSLIDYPGRIASIVFTGGCNFRCRFCYNGSLIGTRAVPDIDPDDIIAELRSRRDFVEGLVVTGGEPTIHPSIISFLRNVKKIGIDVKLDTNGTHPEILEWVIHEKLAEYIAMDYKAPIAKLENVACIRGAEDRVTQSVKILKEHPEQRYEFRTTVHPLIHDPFDIDDIAIELRGARAYYLQQFHPFGSLDPELAATPPFPATFFHAAASRLRGLFPVFGIRNLREAAKEVTAPESMFLGVEPPDQHHSKPAR